MAMFDPHLPPHAVRSNPSSEIACIGQTDMHLPQEPSSLWRHLSPVNGASCTHGTSVMTEKNLPQHPDSVISMLFIPKEPSPAMRATCLWDQTL